MDIRNCKRCGNIYNYSGTAVCNNCTKQEQEDFDKVREYLFEHPNSPAMEISQAIEVEVKVISRFLKEGRLRLESEKQSDLVLTCEKCGQLIKTGRFCEECLQEIQTEFKKAVKPIKNMPLNNGSPWSQGKLHTYEHILKKKD